MTLSQLLPQPNHRLRRLLTREQIKNPYPAFLYKYRTGCEEYLDRLIVHNEFYFSHRDQFNDPFDARCQMLYEGSREQKLERFNKLIEGRQLRFKERAQLRAQFLDPEKIGPLVQRSFEHTADHVGIYSLTENPRSLLMWAHYANSHQGICLQFYVPSSPIFREAFPVKYSDDFLKINWVTSDDEQENLTMTALLTKSLEWKYEEEWRILKKGHPRTQLSINPGALIGVIYGARCQSKAFERVRDLINERIERGHPPLFEWKAKLSPAHFGVGIFRHNSTVPKKWTGRASTQVRSVASLSEDSRPYTPK
ncbi:DUF2971 domain-containing protein [Burkholderia multivorans]|uniref:DUF2971 domain-containing protein n=1 Tax=Burkholderia multivorans TaxID=87883 RepID=UPI0021C245D5|nr:DUF2971 domain-containing protein [Burkholderia multivorans]